MSGREQCCDHILSRGHSTCALRGTQAQSARPGRSDDQRDQNNSFRCNNSGTSVAESLSHKAGSFDWNEFVGPFSNSIAKTGRHEYHAHKRKNLAACSFINSIGVSYRQARAG